jgi:hypothetical protein
VVRAHGKGGRTTPETARAAPNGVRGTGQ